MMFTGKFYFISGDWSVQIMFLLDSILADYVSKTFSISSLLFIVFSYVFLHICDIGCYCSFLILFVLSKKPALDFIDIFYYCLISVLFISSLIFIISFLLMTLGSVYSFFPQVLLDGRIDYLRYYLFLEKGLYHEFPSLNYFCCIL